MPQWIRGHELPHPPFGISKRRLIELIRCGAVIPYEESEPTLYPDPGEPVGLRRIMPTYRLGKIRDRLAWFRYQLHQNERWLSLDDEKHEKAQADFRERFPDSDSVDVPETRRRLLAEIQMLRTEVRQLEALLSPARAWTCLDDLSATEQERLRGRLTEAAFYDQGPVLGATSHPQQAAAEIIRGGHQVEYEMVKEAALEFEAFWKVIQKRISSAYNDIERCQPRVIKAFDTGQWEYIQRAFLQDKRLYELNRPGDEKADFIGRLHAKRLGRAGGIQELYKLHRRAVAELER